MDRSPANRGIPNQDLAQLVNNPQKLMKFGSVIVTQGNLGESRTGLNMSKLDMKPAVSAQDKYSRMNNVSNVVWSPKSTKRLQT